MLRIAVISKPLRAGGREDLSGLDAGGGVPVLSGEHGRISHAA